MKLKNCGEVFFPSLFYQCLNPKLQNPKIESGFTFEPTHSLPEAYSSGVKLRQFAFWSWSLCT